MSKNKINENKINENENENEMRTKMKYRDILSMVLCIGCPSRNERKKKTPTCLYHPSGPAV
jgi:hypothetical protein